MVVPGTTLLTSRDFRYRLERSGASAVVVDESLVGAIDDVDECPSLKVKIRVDTSDTRRRDDNTSEEENSSSYSPSSFSSWFDFRRLLAGAEEASEFTPTRAEDPMMIFFTSGTTGVRPCLCLCV